MAETKKAMVERQSKTMDGNNGRGICVLCLYRGCRYLPDYALEPDGGLC